MTRPSLFHRSPTRHRQRDPLELTRLRRRRAHAVSEQLSASPAAAVEAQVQAQPADGEDGRGRGRAAGGPVDLATYSCGCGLIFSAPVSTTVACPHCGCEQAW